MESIGERLVWRYFPGTDILIPLGGINVLTVFNTLVVMALLGMLFWFGSRKLAMIPGRAQVALEMFVNMFDGLVTSSLELPSPEENRKFLPLIATLFAFLLLANFMGFPPSDLFEEPTADINCTLALGLMGMVIATWCGVRTKGGWSYFSELFGPMWSQEGARGMALFMGKASGIFFFPLNLIGEVAKVISISFRLFGNIMGGGIILVVVSTLVYHMVLPIGLDLFFVFFVGTVQAFVFTMLTLTYIAVAIK